MSRSATDRLRVLQSFPRPRSTTNPYLVQLLAALEPECEVLTFTWRAALTSRWDVLHVHWPETMLRGTTRVRTVARHLRFALLMTRVTLTRAGLVRTLHNVAPHEAPGVAEDLLHRWCDRRTDLWIRLNPLTSAPSTAPVRTILHGDYRAWFAGTPTKDTVPGRLLFFGLVRPYKGVENLLASFTALPDPGLSLHVTGRVTDVALREDVERRAAQDPRITLFLEHVTDPRLAEEVSSAQLVVLPYREMHNSGAALLALSLGRPVLVPRSPVTELLAQEVGPSWVHLFDGDLGPAHLARAIAAVRPVPQPGPDLTARSWDTAGSSHAAVYREARARHVPRRRGFRP